jgi:hypothetical protein
MLFCLVMVSPTWSFEGKPQPQGNIQKGYEKPTKVKALPKLVASTDRKKQKKQKVQTPLVYIPPKTGVPSGREGGGTRGNGYHVPRLDVFAPAPDQVIGMTVQEQPNLYWYISEAETFPMMLTINEEQNVQPILETEIPRPDKPGVYQIPMSQYGVQLHPGKIYRWYVSVVRDPEFPSRDIVAGARIQRRLPDQRLLERLANSNVVEDAYVNAQEGLWYDAVASISEALQAYPDDQKIQEMRSDLLQQVGLHEVLADESKLR